MNRDPFERALTPSVEAAPSAEPASWLHGRLLPWGAGGTLVCSVVPTGFEAYTRILHPAYGPGPDAIPIRWSEAAAWAGCIVHAEMQWEPLTEPIPAIDMAPPWDQEPHIGWCPPEVTTPLIEHLAGFTSTPDSVWFGMWVGFTDVMAVMKTAPRFELPHREYILLNGPVTAAAQIITSPYTIHTGPSLWWPQDRAWFVATEVDFRWTYVGGTEACIRSIEGDSRLEALRTHPEHRGDLGGDMLNDILPPSTAPS